MSRIIRWLLICLNPFLAISVLLFFGSFLAFVVDFTVHNKTAQTLNVTPVGTAGSEGRRYPLPLCFWRFPSLLQSRRGGFSLGPGESITLMYDMDDINFSEIVVEDAAGGAYQLVVNPHPTVRQYHAPEQRDFVIRDLRSLDAVPASVRKAAIAAKQPLVGAYVLIGLLIVPWIAHFTLRRCAVLLQ